MKVNKEEKGEFGNFKIYETEGREITKKFIDVETKLLIVIEKYRDLDAWGGYSFEFITINPENGKVIEIEERGKIINYDEQKSRDEDSNLIWTTKRIPRPKGNETIKIEIYHPSEKKPIKSEYYHAFSDKPHKPIPVLYQQIIKQREENKIQKEKAFADYLKKNYKDRVKYWSGNLHQQMRWNGESGFDEYALFSRNWFEEVKRYEPEFDKILEDIFENYWRGYWDIKKIRERLKK